MIIRLIWRPYAALLTRLTGRKHVVVYTGYYQVVDQAKVVATMKSAIEESTKGLKAKGDRN